MTRAVFPARKGKRKIFKRKKRKKERERKKVRGNWCVMQINGNVIDSNGIKELLIV